MTDRALADMVDRAGRRTFVNPDHVAGVAPRLVSGLGALVAGHTVVVDGGRTA